MVRHNAIVTMIVGMGLLIGIRALNGQNRSDSSPSLADALRVAEPLRTASSLRTVCQAFVRIQAAKDANDYGHLKQTDFQDASHCMGYVTGWMDTASEQLSCVDGRLYSLKFVGDIRVSQVIRVFLQFIDGRPEYEEQGAQKVLGKSLGEKRMIGSFSVPFSECKE